MDMAFLPASGLGLMFMLGLRHGFDPDHIAMIDSMAYRTLDRRAQLAPWVGTLFALGHGLAVTAIAVALGAFASDIALPSLLRVILDWLPCILLFVVGILNLHALLGQRAYQPRGWKMRFVPARLRDSSHPLAVFAIGILFALVFDTATQAAAWGYAATEAGGSAMALMAGLAFTAGMTVTDTVDGRVMLRLLRQASGAVNAGAYRRGIGWAVVVMSFAMGAYAAVTQLRAGAGMDAFSMTVTGAGLFAGALAAWSILRWRSRRSFAQPV
jgi:high-affinity nickel-transport protein